MMKSLITGQSQECYSLEKYQNKEEEHYHTKLKKKTFILAKIQTVHETYNANVSHKKSFNFCTNDIQTN